jgi:DNA invertase Pin-like site-specific DNA recombinase
MTVGVMAVVAQHEREAISQRTKAALAVAKARGTILGGRRKGAAMIVTYQSKGVAAAREKAREAAELRRETIETLARDGLSLNAMAARLNADIVTASRGGHWTATAVKRIIKTLSNNLSGDLNDSQHLARRLK